MVKLVTWADEVGGPMRQRALNWRQVTVTVRAEVSKCDLQEEIDETSTEAESPAPSPLLIASSPLPSSSAAPSLTLLPEAPEATSEKIQKNQPSANYSANTMMMLTSSLASSSTSAAGGIFDIRMGAMPEYVIYDNDEQDESTLIRLVLSVAEADYTTTFVDEDQHDFYGVQMKSVPALEINGMRISNISTICRHLGWRYNLSGGSVAADAMVDMIADAVAEARARFRRWVRVVEYRDLDDSNLEELEAEATHYITQYFGPAFEEKLKQGGGRWLVGDDLTWADLALAEFLNPIIHQRPALFDRLPLLYAHAKRVADLPAAEGVLYGIRERAFRGRQQMGAAAACGATIAASKTQLGVFAVGYH